jgi:hypothetical protein
MRFGEFIKFRRTPNTPIKIVDANPNHTEVVTPVGKSGGMGHPWSRGWERVQRRSFRASIND